MKFGIESPLVLKFNQQNGKAYLAKGNYRLAAAMSEGILYLPVHVTSQWLEPSESGNFKIIANHLEISNITEELLPQHFGLNIKSTYVSEFDRSDLKICQQSINSIIFLAMT